MTAAGKNVAPAPLEDRLRAHPLISQAVVVGDARPFIAAMITLDEEALQEWAAETGRPAQTAEALAEDPALKTAIQHAVDDATCRCREPSRFASSGSSPRPQHRPRAN